MADRPRVAAAAGVRAVRDRDEFDAVANVTGATPVPTVDRPTADAVGTAGAVRRRSVGPTRALVVGAPPESASAATANRATWPRPA